MKRTVNLVLALASASLVLAPLTACSTGSTQSGTTYKSEFGTVKATLGYPLDKVYDAAQKTMKDFEFKVDKQMKDAFEANIMAVGSGDKKYEVKMKKTGEKTTDVSVSIGSFGDETRSREILSKIEQHCAG